MPLPITPAALPIACRDPLFRTDGGFGVQPPGKVPDTLGLCQRLFDPLRCHRPLAVPSSPSPHYGKRHFVASTALFGQAPPCPPARGPPPSPGMLPGGTRAGAGASWRCQHSASPADKSFSRQTELRRGTKELNLFKTQPGVQTSLSYCISERVSRGGLHKGYSSRRVV